MEALEGILRGAKSRLKPKLNQTKKYLKSRLKVRK